MAVIGAGTADAGLAELAEAVGRGLADAGCRIVCGGRGGVMEAAARGAQSSPRWDDGTVVGILPGGDAAEANPYVDIVLPTALGLARNVLVVRAADAIIAVGGGSGTLSELALGWQLGKPIVALATSGGWAAKLAGATIDDRRTDTVVEASSPAEAVAAALRAVDGAPTR